MSKPLSVLKYYRNNPKQVAIVLVIVSLSIFLQYALLIYQTTTLKLWRATMPFKSNVYVYVQKSKQSQFKQLLSKQPAISKVLPFKLEDISIRPMGSTAIFLLHSKDMKSALNALQLTLIKGRLPAPGTHEVALHWRIAALKGLKIGNDFGNQYFGGDFLMGGYKLVSLLDGDILTGFADLDTYSHDYHLSPEDTAFLVIPQKGQLAKVDSFLAQCVRIDSKLYTFHKHTILDDSSIDIICFVITCIVTICVSFLFYIYFYQRRPEMCLLRALGYTRRRIIGKAFFEISGISLAGSILGGAVCFLSGQALNGLMFMKRGLPLELWNMSYPFKLLLTPLVIIVSSLVIIRRMLKKADLISIMEGEG